MPEQPRLRVLLFALILVFMWGLTAWMAYSDGKAYWTYVGTMALTVLAGLASGTVARICADVLHGGEK